MSHEQQKAASIFNLSMRTVVVSLLCAGVFATIPLAQAQTYQVLYNFTGGADGANPYAGLTMDAAGNLYGTANVGGYTGNYCASNYGCGTVFKLTRHSSGWTFTPLYAFKGDDVNGGENDGAYPVAAVTIGPDGSLYGTTEAGGGGSCYYFHNGCGAVFKLSPPPAACKTALCPWRETVIYSLASDSGFEAVGDVIFDSAGNLYGTVALGGPYDGGYVFELTPSYGGWTEQTVYAFNPNNEDCNAPMAGLVFDASGNLYGTANNGCGLLYGGVFQLVPSGSGWTENILLRLNGFGDGDGTEASLTPDGRGGFYGTTEGLGPNGHGTVFELTPSDGGWAYSLVYGFGGGGGAYPAAPVTLDASGNLYGTTVNSGDLGIGDGTVFQLTFSGGAWTQNVLHYFEGSDGQYPHSNVLRDPNGNLYGTTSYGGAYNNGVVWEITP
jgi:uncharacterized repeat protein (TIGR03803 family)